MVATYRIKALSFAYFKLYIPGQQVVSKATGYAKHGNLARAAAVRHNPGALGAATSYAALQWVVNVDASKYLIFTIA